MNTRFHSLLIVCLCWLGVLAGGQAQEIVYRSELVFPLRADHNHAPSIVELPDGSFLASWYRGSGERKADDVAVFG
ncbi:MAG: exo-alpha-sialidase, partial [Planctomycetota bacterium]|nr:exo-alpha-sialidase [Planctomycetota bacterium]